MGSDDDNEIIDETDSPADLDLEVERAEETESEIEKSEEPA